MKLNLETQKKIASEWFKYLQLEMCKEFEELERKAAKRKNIKTSTFKKEIWNKKNPKDGGGQYYLLKKGQIFDQIGINYSKVQGVFPKNFKSKIPGTKNSSSYWAAGISIVAHMKNPKIPALHFNTRFIVTSKSWFGGGMDATPSYKDNKEKFFIHEKLKKLCKSNKKNNTIYKKWCDKYFYIKHRKEPRGIGGIFFDYLYKDWKKNFKFVRELGICFLTLSKDVINKKVFLKWNKKQKSDQFFKRRKYVEFNLLYDRGTKFGLNTGGNIDAIFMSLPPLYEK